jgi:hypothetical protein
MDSTVLIVIGAVLAVGLIARLFFSPRQPKEKQFRCTRCKSPSGHTERTIKAWREGKTTFFCNICHAKWLETRPHTANDARGARTGGGRSGSGCLSAIAVVTVVPLGIAAYVLLR